MKRVLQCGGAVEPTKFAGQFMGPPRVWMHAQRVGGLAVSRAMGDCAYLSAGVIAVPEFSAHQLVPKKDLFIVSGSDGIYDHMTNEEVIQMVHKNLCEQNKTVNQCAQILVTEARRRWRATGMGYVDDVTAVILDLRLLSVLNEA
jgi:serine/threonine protein phosphatase PrpC